MNAAEKINRWTARFASKTTEADFQRFIFDGNLRTNIIALAIAIPLNALYIFADPFLLENADEALTIRLSVLSACIALLALLRLRSLRRFHEILTGVIVTLFGIAIIMIVWREPTLENNYYVGLVQGGVFISFLLRLSFLKSLAVMVVTLALFTGAAQGKTAAEETVLQIVVVATMYAMCAFGIYFLQRFRRHDFLKTQMIEAQNVQLSAMLTDVRLDNERKLAAMNTLVHLVRTPVHQIAGFTDVVLNALSNQDNDAASDNCIESAVYIKNASNDLSANVTKLLTYHRLDDLERNAEKTQIHLTSMLQDMRDEIVSEIFSALKVDQCDITNYVEPIQTALNCIVANYNQNLAAITQVEISLEDCGAYAIVSFIDNGPGFEPGEFEELTKPLTKLDNYLSFDSSKMPMGLRTVARAAELCGGALTYRKIDGRNVFSLTLRNFDTDAGNFDVDPADHLRLVG